MLPAVSVWFAGRVNGDQMVVWRGVRTVAGCKADRGKTVGWLARCRECSVGVVEGLQGRGPPKPEASKSAENDKGEGVSNDPLRCVS